ncbi:rhomboid family intramembrane serine protease [Anaerosporobacter faecicola]|uniref:rhomboid family intramembrane serine protease n=1 Tax=Anaerosporobacter faecicola TaxID=2718714 RepID=UPI00143B1B64|nr:rhomboid family intramembrane serine protease [Anaerosporobacter faecicola]
MIFGVDFLVLNKADTVIWSADHLLYGNQWGYLTQYGRLLNVRAMNPEWWRLLTCQFLHSGVLHLFVNGIGLICIGSIVEKRVGAKRFLLCYLLSGIGSALITMFFTYGSVGASGAIFGLAGMLLVFMIRERKQVWSREPIFKRLLILAYLILPNLSGINSIVSHEAGLICGIVAGLLLVGKQENEEKLELN